MTTKIQQSTERRQQTVRSRIDPIISELGEEANDAPSAHAAEVLRFARKTLSAASRDLTPDAARASAAAMRQVAALWPTSHAYEGAVRYFDSLARMAA